MRLAFTLISLIALQSVFAQTFKFQHYREQEGLNNRFIYTLDQDANGYLLAGTSEGLYLYNGCDFKVLTTEDSLSENFITCSFKADDGTIWYGHYNGNITKFKDGICYPLRNENLPTSCINDISADKDGNIWIVSQRGGLIKLDPSGKLVKYTNGLEDFTLYTLEVDNHGNLWLGSDMGLLQGKLSKSENIEIEFVDEIMETKVSCISQVGPHQYLVGTEDMGIFELSTTEDFSIQSLQCNGFDLSKIAVNSISRDTDNNLWICTNADGLFRLSNPVNGVWQRIVDYSDGNLMGSSSIQKSLKDREGNLWIGSKGNGLIKLVDDYFAIFHNNAANDSLAVTTIFQRNDSIWTGVGSTIFCSIKIPNQLAYSIGANEGFPETDVTTVYCDENGNLWAGTDGLGLFVMPAGKKKMERVTLKHDDMNLRINQLIGVGQMLFVATDDGIFQLRNNLVVAHLSMQSGLSYNVVKTMFLDSKGRVWIGTHNNEISYIEDGIIKSFPCPVQDITLDIKSIAEDKMGNIWMGTAGVGIIKASANETVVYNRINGLYSDYCYSLVCDDQNRLWIGHRGAVSRVNLSDNTVQVFNPGLHHDMEFSENAVTKMSSGMLLFGTNEGVLRYDPEKDQKNSFEPVLNITSINIADSIYTLTDFIRLPYGEYKIEFGFVGISLKKSDQVNYQYFLEGFDNEWNDAGTVPSALYRRLTPGDYVFKVRAFNSDGVGGTVLKEMRLSIGFPFWQKWWFILSCAFVLVMAVRFFVVRRERFLKENQEYLQLELAQRTREVVEQKELLEIKNKDITDSILYAKNIQKAMLPAPDSLTKMFPDSFVYYKPRDIVSGDFYWVNQTDGKILLACADCTGHGVPGAFMSLIGSTLLKEVAQMPFISTPRQILSALDREISQLINRKESTFSVDDGIDISILEFDTATKQLRAASANRPIVIYRDGTRHELKGDRHAVGGSQRAMEKEFSQHEMQLHRGDVIYMFSDGITDQFGGSDGKKLKKSGLIKLLDTIFHIDMVQQRKIIRDKFMEWKGPLAQVDDVILMGVRV